MESICLTNASARLPSCIWPRIYVNTVPRLPVSRRSDLASIYHGARGGPWAWVCSNFEHRRHPFPPKELDVHEFRPIFTWYITVPRLYSAEAFEFKPVNRLAHMR